MYRMARGLQRLGLIVLPFSILLELEGTLRLGQSLAFSAFGVCLFLMGYFLQSASSN